MNNETYRKISITQLIEIKKLFDFYRDHIWCDMNSGTILDEEDLKKDGGNRACNGIKIVNNILNQ